MLLEYILTLTEKTRRHDKIMLGISPRGGLALVRCAKAYAAMQGRDFVLPDDIKTCVLPVFAHRLVLGGLSLGSDYQAEALMRQILEEVPVPSEQFSRPGR